MIKVLKSLDYFHFFIICKNYFRYSVLSFFYFWNSYCKFKQKALWFSNKHSFKKDSWGINTDVNICFTNYKRIRTNMIKTHQWYSLNQNNLHYFSLFRSCVILRLVIFVLIFSLNYHQGVRQCYCINKWEEVEDRNWTTTKKT